MSYTLYRDNLKDTRFFQAFLPTRATTRKRVNNPRSCSRYGAPLSISVCVAGRIFLPSPKYHGITFHEQLSFLCMPLPLSNIIIFFAVSSLLFLDTNPLSAWGPGASSKNNTLAKIPPSHGSKYGIKNIWTSFISAFFQINNR